MRPYTSGGKGGKIEPGACSSADRASDFGSEGRGFKSCQARYLSQGFLVTDWQHTFPLEVSLPPHQELYPPLQLPAITTPFLCRIIADGLQAYGPCETALYITTGAGHPAGGPYRPRAGSLQRRRRLGAARSPRPTRLQPAALSAAPRPRSHMGGWLRAAL